MPARRSCSAERLCQVPGRAIRGGHFLAEESPTDVTEALVSFLNEYAEFGQ